MRQSGFLSRARISRRDVLRSALAGARLLIARRSFGAAPGAASGPAPVGPVLGDADANGIKLLPRFRSRVLARSGKAPAPGSNYRWHASPDGGACFAGADGGWSYVSKHERT